MLSWSRINIVPNKLSQTDNWLSPCGQAVFVANLKCASTFYETNLLHNQWQMIPYDYVDWDRHFVWSTIMDPYHRYCRGLKEDLKGLGSIDHWLSLPDAFWQGLAWVGAHSMPMGYVFGDKIDQIHWVPIDITRDHRQLARELLEPMGIEIRWVFDQPLHKSGPADRATMELIKQKCQSTEKFDLLHNQFADYRVYQRVLEKYR